MVFILVALFALYWNEYFALAMAFFQVGYTGMNIVLKLVMDLGKNPFVHVIYGIVFVLY